MRWALTLLPLLSSVALAQGAHGLTMLGHGQSHPLTVVTLNIRSGLGLDGDQASFDPRPNLAAIAQVLSAERAEVVLLQEVERGRARSMEVDEAAFVADLLGMSHRFAPAFEVDGGEFGLALLTTWEVASHEVVPLSVPDLTETRPELSPVLSQPRVAQVARLVSGEVEIAVINLHLGLTQEQRAVQLREAAALVSRESVRPVLLGGDLNAEPDARALWPIREMMRDSYQGFVDANGFVVDIPISSRETFPSWQPLHCIDYIFSRGPFDITDLQVIDTQVSDHLPVAVRFVLHR